MKLKNFARNLIQWYEKNKRDLPWRKTSDPYKIWISEVMLQQTTVATVIPYFDRWIKKFPNIKKVAKTPIEKILKMWQGLGYYQRARNLHNAAQIIVNDFNSKLPQDVDQMRKLPGFGPYTTGAVLSIAFDKRVPIIDANVRRVIMRILAIKGFADTTQDEAIYKFLDLNMPQKDLRSFNQAMMELGALICKSSQPLCLMCPVRDDCQAFKKGIQEIIPKPKLRSIKNLEVAIGIIKNDEKYFIQKRPSKGLLADLWEFPSGKIEKGEKPVEALKRELKEELDVEVRQAKHLMNVVHFYTQFRVNLHVFDCLLDKFPIESKTQKWIAYSEFQKYPLPSGTAKIIDKLAK